MENITVKYCFVLPDGSREVFDLEIDGATLDLLGAVPESPPPWTNLDFHQCPNCPLTADTHPQCPLSMILVPIVEQFDAFLSYEEIHLEAKVQNRLVSQDTTVQKGVSSLMGLLMATSGCPHTVFFKPMARFHLPLARVDETVCRTASLYLLAQYFRQKEALDTDFDLKGLARIYHEMHVVNSAVAKRLRAASETDSSVNAIVLLDMFAGYLPDVIDHSLEKFQYLFAPFLRD
ncbi:DUF6901 family protein [Planctomycetota bacterium]